MNGRCYVISAIFSASLIAISTGSASAECVSYGTSFDHYEKVCFEKTMDQYTCFPKNYGMKEDHWQHVQRLSLRISLEDSGSCTVVDRHNTKPYGSPVRN